MLTVKATDFAGFPCGAVIGFGLALVAIELNLQGFIDFRTALEKWNINIGNIVTFLCLVYIAILCVDFVILVHGTPASPPHTLLLSTMRLYC